MKTRGLTANGWEEIPNQKKDEAYYFVEAVISKFQDDLRELLTRESKKIIDEAVKRITGELDLSGNHYISADNFTKI
jgi:hypothetical protein